MKEQGRRRGEGKKKWGNLVKKWHPLPTCAETAQQQSTRPECGQKANATATHAFEVLQGLVKSHENYAFCFLMYYCFCKFKKGFFKISSRAILS